MHWKEREKLFNFFISPSCGSVCEIDDDDYYDEWISEIYTSPRRQINCKEDSKMKKNKSKYLFFEIICFGFDGVRRDEERSLNWIKCRIVDLKNIKYDIRPHPKHKEIVIFLLKWYDDDIIHLVSILKSSEKIWKEFSHKRVQKVQEVMCFVCCIERRLNCCWLKKFKVEDRIMVITRRRRRMGKKYTQHTTNSIWLHSDRVWQQTCARQWNKNNKKLYWRKNT